MKWAGFLVVPLLLAGFAVLAYLGTRPPERELDAAGEAWVSGYESWSSAQLRRLDVAVVRMEFGAHARNARLVAPLRRCTASLTRLGEPPELLASVQRLALEGCGRAEHAVRLNDRFDTASLASIKLHLGEAEDRIALSRRVLRLELGDSGSETE